MTTSNHAPRWGRLALAVGLVLTPACQTAKETAFFTTRTVWGVDIDPQPPTFDLGYGRTEGSVAPVVDGGEVLPLLASFSGRSSFLGGALGFGVGQSFAVGNAALVMARYMTDERNLSEELDGDDLKSVFHGGAPANIAGSFEDVRPYFFGTTTSLGFKVDLATPTDGSVGAVNLGWKRKELAVVPIREVTEKVTAEDGTTVEQKRLTIPSMIATTSASATATDADEGTGGGVDQFYATGLAATFLAGHPFVRRTLGAKILSDADARQSLIKAIDDDREKSQDLQKETAELLEELNGEQLDRALQVFDALGLAYEVSDWENLEDQAKRDELQAMAFTGDDPELVEALGAVVVGLRRIAEPTP